MHRLLGALTVRGRSFVAAGAAAIVCGLLIPETDLLRIGALLMALPLLSAFGSGRARYRLSCVRQVIPSRLPIAEVMARLAEVQAEHPDAEVRRGSANRWEIWPPSTKA